MVKDEKGQLWAMVLVTRHDDTQFLDIAPGAENDDGTPDIPVMGVYAWALFPEAKAIDYQGHPLPNPVRQLASSVRES